MKGFHENIAPVVRGRTKRIWLEVVGLREKHLHCCPRGLARKLTSAFTDGIVSARLELGTGRWMFLQFFLRKRCDSIATRVMPSPRNYFDNPREAELAERVWTISATLPGKWQLQWSHEIFENAWWPWVNKRIIWARDWITTKRESDGVGGITTLNQELKTDYKAEEIADVEHFYVAALLGTLGGPAGGVMLNAVGDGVWEMVVGPVRIAWGCTLKYGAKVGARATVQSVKDNWTQLTGPDWAGTRFGSFYVFNELRETMSDWLRVRTNYYSSQLSREYQELRQWLSETD